MNSSQNLALLLFGLFLFGCHTDDVKNTYTIKGRVGYENDVLVIDPTLPDPFVVEKYITKVILVLGDQVIASSTDEDFEFKNLEEGKSYTIIPQSVKKGLKGTTALDFVILRKYIQGIDELNSWQRKIAADVNQDNQINQTDLDLLYDCLINTPCIATSFRFVTDDYDGNGAGFIDQFSIHQLRANTEINFLPIRLGDVNGSVY
ncbi:MAG: dockerin type I domain-containing protein [Saprospiraceae bacterium]